MRTFEPCVYIMASGHHGTLYIGVTSDIEQRVLDHQSGALGGFTAEYGCKRLVWMELHPTMESAILREKRMKSWRRAWKIRVIEESNPQWHPLDAETGLPVPEEQLERNLRGGWTDSEGNLVRNFDA